MTFSCSRVETSAKSPIEVERRLRALRGQEPGPLTRPCMDTARSPHHPRTAVPFEEKCGVTPRLWEEKT